ncbi:alpha-D-ribose 1-methylphosphonate 5-triphosphate diphosphatase [Natronomonas moolapensis 8.8.11]|uniref:Alpha-D-ribose 1-methylphosphonate 5-triphosphate diphosphatase n=1 Tax=Natronomonas moolapensis (strain DSM 18674 / CECT 7526 / JCM 14361 / 8.8.11) TaxID=268739 RepID=M1XPW3_NATM8|nr:alpha-D-ribose 1-methylphosphonate 5-triphosphate diphosphatase [Natronomonas moolapensis]CCQ36110.1 alpha-D-ribose 1-methylphosphonate 5-triphosphate diphosphatase [Natronomonas moolapensis 8.8.11]
MTTNQQLAQSYCLTNARIVTPETVLQGSVRIEGDRIAAVGPDVDPTRGDDIVDADGQYLLPGLIDLHGDDIEGQLQPRNGARMDTAMALGAADRSNVAAGITTKYHAIAFENDPEEGRTTELAAELTEAIEAADSWMADHRIHVRCEVTQEEAVTAAIRDIQRDAVDLVSVMSHIPGKGQFEDIAAFKKYYETSDRHTVAEAERFIEERTSISMVEIRDRIDRVVKAARDAGVVTASHDDEDPQEVERLSERGVDIAEYPITLETAKRANELGMTTVMGAPNLVRGESQWGNLTSIDAADAGVLDVLCVDYHPPSLLAAPFVDTGEPLPKRVARVTKNPADAVGLQDRGRIAEGARADLVVVDTEETPTVSRAFVAGRGVYKAEGS